MWSTPRQAQRAGLSLAAPGLAGSAGHPRHAGRGKRNNAAAPIARRPYSCASDRHRPAETREGLGGERGEPWSAVVALPRGALALLWFCHQKGGCRPCPGHRKAAGLPTGNADPPGCPRTGHAS